MQVINQSYVIPLADCNKTELHYTPLFSAYISKTKCSHAQSIPCWEEGGGGKRQCLNELQKEYCMQIKLIALD